MSTPDREAEASLAAGAPAWDTHFQGAALILKTNRPKFPNQNFNGIPKELTTKGPPLAPDFSNSSISDGS